MSSALQSILFLFTLSSAFLLMGCSHLNSDFDCPMPPGVMCKSIDQINTMVDEKKLGAKDSNCTCNYKRYPLLALPYPKKYVSSR